MKRLLLLVLPVLTLLAQQGSAPPLTADTVAGLAMRNIPGTFSSGRIADVAIDPRNRSVWYVATASGGLWKTTNHGISFDPIFDNGGSYSLGCVTVDPKNPDTVWLGTGENQAQRAIGYGDGIYKSTDAGKTWKNMGLPNSEHIGKIWVDPRNPDTVWVAAQGPLFSPGGDRGLFKTTDGGQTWKPSLTISPDTGVTDFDVDPRNPDIMYAAAYQRRRTTSIIVAGGPESAIYKSTDAGAHWTRLTEGIPTVDKGRIALAVSPQKPDTVYATITTNQQNKLTGMYRSDDAGAHWAKLNDFIVQDPEYYGEIFADPFKEGRVYLMDMAVRVSEDYGKTITAAGWQVHADNHSLTFDPTDPNHLLEGNDGGLYESYDHGRSWRHFNNIPVTQFYRVSLDNALPFYHIYGGAQDNGSQGVPSRTLNRAGIRTSDWMNTGGGDGFQSRADYADPNTVYSCSQNIACTPPRPQNGRQRQHSPPLRRGGCQIALALGHPVHPQPALPHPPVYRRQSPDAQRRSRRHLEADRPRPHAQHRSRHHPRDGQTLGRRRRVEERLHRSIRHRYRGRRVARQRGTALRRHRRWPACRSPKTAARTGARCDTFPGVPDMTYVTDVHPSPHDANTVFVTLNDFHRGNFKPYIMKSTDLGKTWASVSGDLPQRDPVWTVVQDPVNPDLLFSGTEFGLSFTLDGGRRWVRLKGGMPVTPIRDLEIQARESDLVAASFGRGFFVLDDFAALRGLTPQTALAGGRALRARPQGAPVRRRADSIARRAITSRRRILRRERC